MAYNKDELLDRIRPVIDPELGFSIVDLGLVYDAVHNDDGSVDVTMTLTTPMCPLGPQIANEVIDTLQADEQITSARLHWSFDPPWNPHEMASEEVKWGLGLFS